LASQVRSRSVEQFSADTPCIRSKNLREEIAEFQSIVKGEKSRRAAKAAPQIFPSMWAEYRRIAGVKQKDRRAGKAARVHDLTPRQALYIVFAAMWSTLIKYELELDENLTLDKLTTVKIEPMVAQWLASTNGKSCDPLLKWVETAMAGLTGRDVHDIASRIHEKSTGKKLSEVTIRAWYRSMQATFSRNQASPPTITEKIIQRAIDKANPAIAKS